MIDANSTFTAQVVRCPECGGRGTKVKRITLESLLTANAARRIGDGQYRFCDAIDCDTVYFGDNGASFSKSDLTVRVGVKERTSGRHVCYCFDHTIEDINAQVQQTGQSTVLDDIKARIQTGCWCETKNPQGSCCLGTVNNYVQQAIAEHGCTLAPGPFDEKYADQNAAGAQSQNETGTAVVHACLSNTDSAENAGHNSPRTGMIAVGGSVLSALAASACCWIPLMLIAFGISAGGVSAWFEQYRWLFLGLTAVLLGAGFYFVYFREPRCAPGSACATPKRRLQRFNRVMLWTATIVVIAAAAFPKYVGYLIPQGATAQTVVPANHVATASLGIDGMTCEGCAVLVKNALVKVPGVLEVSVSYADSSATISFDDSTPPSAASLASAVEGAGYQADTSAMSR